MSEASDTALGDLNLSETREACCEEGCDEPVWNTTRRKDGELWDSRCHWHSDVHQHHVHVTLGKDSRGGYVIATVNPVHTHECPYWRMGSRHGPCNCGAHEVWEAFEQQAKDKRRQITPYGVWTTIRQIAVNGGDVMSKVLSRGSS